MTAKQTEDLAVAAGQCADALDAAARAAEPISLEEVMSDAALQIRMDKKFLLTPAQFTELMGRLRPDFRILDIKGRRLFNYETVYFDTPDLEIFAAHKQGRRKRYKVRTRVYADSGLCMFEAKFKGLRGQTVKHRIPYEVQDRNWVTGDAKDFLRERLRTEYNLPMPHLEPVMRSDYVRGTFVNPMDEERLTCDVNMVYIKGESTVQGPELFVIETKTTAGRGAADIALSKMGIRPVVMSKYCVGIALLYPELAANKWSRLLRQNFGWNRSARQTQD